MAAAFPKGISDRWDFYSKKLAVLKDAAPQRCPTECEFWMQYLPDLRLQLMEYTKCIHRSVDANGEKFDYARAVRELRELIVWIEQCECRKASCEIFDSTLAPRGYHCGY